MRSYNVVNNARLVLNFTIYVKLLWKDKWNFRYNKNLKIINADLIIIIITDKCLNVII